MINKEKYCYKLNEEDKQDIIKQYCLDSSIENQNALCSKYNITRQTIWKLSKTINEDKKQEIINESIKEYQKTFTKKTTLIIDKMLNRIAKQVENENDKMALSQLVTSLGILYDKLRLNENLSTSNNSIKIDIKIE